VNNVLRKISDAVYINSGFSWGSDPAVDHFLRKLPATYKVVDDASFQLISTNSEMLEYTTDVAFKKWFEEVPQVDFAYIGEYKEMYSRLKLLIDLAYKKVDIILFEGHDPAFRKRFSGYYFVSFKEMGRQFSIYYRDRFQDLFQ
jgi:hypothetical protein